MIPISANIDWLQVNVRPLGKKLMCLKKEHNLVDTGVNTKHFGKVQELYENDKRIATIVSEPYSEIMDKSTTIIKLDNHILYQKHLYDYVKNLLTDLCCTFHNFSRLDIAIDFNRFRANRCPERFITAVASKKIIPQRVGKISFDGSIKRVLDYEYMRIGTRNSDVIVYIYNKTRELDEKENKPWIRENWEQNELRTDIPVWRIEFSINNFNYAFVDRDTAEILEIDELAFLLMCRKDIVLHSLINQYFRFVIEDGQARKDRMKKVNMFGDMGEIRHLEKINTFEASNRSDKILIKQLHTTSNELRNNNKRISVNASSLMNHIILKKDLEDWYKRKNIYW